MSPVRPCVALAACALLLGASAARPAVHRVPGDYPRIDVAIAAAAPGDTIRVVGNGGATYPERLIVDRDIRIEGGWRADFQVRDPSIYVSVVRDITGSFQRSVIRVDGPYRVVLDGITVFGGRQGLEAALGADLEIVDCAFRSQNNKDENRRIPGAGVYLRGGSLLMERTSFQDIVSGFPGAGIALVNVSSATVRDCLMSDLVTFPFPQDVFPDAPGAGIYVEGSSNVLLERLDLRRCSSIYNPGGFVHAVASAIEIRDCVMIEGFAGLGGGAVDFKDCPSVLVTGCTIEECVGSQGGGLSAENVPSLTVASTRIASGGLTIVGEEGGGMSLRNSTFVLRDLTLSANFARGASRPQRGGGVHSFLSQGLVERCLFSGELARGAGGAWYQVGGDVTLRDCTFSGNRSDFYGGAAHIRLAGKVRLEHCLFEGNSAKFGGACSAGFSGVMELEHCTLTGNSAQSAGGSMHVGTGGVVEIRNSILCCSQAGDQLYCSSASATVSFSNLWNDDAVNGRTEYGGACPDVTGTDGNLRVAPGFCPGDPSFSVSPSSPLSGAASDGTDIGWAVPSTCRSVLGLEEGSWGRIKARYRLSP